jgi:hypothetical protein
MQEVRAAVQAAAALLGFQIEPPEPDDKADTIARVRTADDLLLDVLWRPADDERELGELDSIHQVLGFLPSASVVFVSYVRSRQDRDVTRLVQAVLEVTGGFAEMDGALGTQYGMVPAGLDQAEKLALARAYVAGRPGQCLEIRYPILVDEDDDPQDAELAMYHVVDAAFLRAWLEDPDFYLIN